MPRPAAVALTDRAWFDYLASIAPGGVLDEVNFWRPQAQTRFRALPVGGPLFFRLKHPVNAIAGYGFFAQEVALPVETAWDFFGMKNGDPTRERFIRRLAGYQQGGDFGLLATGHRRLSCLVLRDAVFLPPSEWLSWGEDRGWRRSIVAYKTYDLDAGEGRALADLLARRAAPSLPDLLPDFVPLAADTNARTYRDVAVTERVAQGTFRARLMAAYGGRCAVTEEHSMPVLDAAHIQPYRGPASNHPQNGLVLRADIHRLYDAGYVTVTPAHRFTVSERLRDEFANGRVYYALDGRRIVLPHDPSLWPSTAALTWHAETVFR